MVWIRRAISLVVLIIIVSGYFIITRTTGYLERENAEKYAGITARIWVATAKYSNDPERYRMFRDSLLGASNITKDELNEYLEEYRSSPQKYILFMTRVNAKVDSIIKIENALLTPRDSLPTDSVLQIN